MSSQGGQFFRLKSNANITFSGNTNSRSKRISKEESKENEWLREGRRKTRKLLAKNKGQGTLEACCQGHL